MATTYYKITKWIQTFYVSNNLITTEAFGTSPSCVVVLDALIIILAISLQRLVELDKMK